MVRQDNADGIGMAEGGQGGETPVFDLDSLAKAENRIMGDRPVDMGRLEKNKQKKGLFNNPMSNVKSLLTPFKNMFN